MKSGQQIFQLALWVSSFLFVHSFGRAQCSLTASGALNDTINCSALMEEPATPVFASTCCDGPISISTFQSSVGSLVQSCGVSTAFGPGPDWSVWIPIVNVSSPYWNFVGQAHFEQYADGTAHVYGTIQNIGDPTLQMIADFWMENGRTWNAWSALGRGYKNDLGLAGQHYVDWTYYELVPRFSRFTGTGATAGSLIEMHHMPSNYYFGFQTGVAANNKNAQPGLSGWFTYDGTFNGTSVEGHGDLNVNQTCSDSNSGCASSEILWLYRAENACGQIGFEQQSLLVVDESAPVISGLPSSIQIACNEVLNLDPVVLDDCSEVMLNFQDEVIIEGCPGQFIRNYTATDACGNASSYDVTVSVLSPGNLEFTEFPSDITLPCDFESIPVPTITYNEVCAGTSISMSQERVDGNCPGSYDLLQIYTITDQCGNELSQTWTIHIVDAVAPEFVETPQDITLFCDDQIPASSAIAEDACGEVSIDFTESEEVSECGRVITRTWVASDLCGNTSSYTQHITVVDDAAPVFVSVPAEVFIGCGDEYTYVPNAVDACSEVAVSFSDVPLDGCAGGMIRTWLASDACGNTATAQTRITRVDNAAPIMTQFPQDVYADCSEIPSTLSAGIEYIDNCTDVQVSFVEVTKGGDCAYDFIIERTWTLTDACGNSSQWLWRIYVVDQVAPVFSSLPGDLTLSCQEDVPPAANLGATDNCSGLLNLQLNELDAITGCERVITRTWIATDVCGNSASHTQRITITDNDAPIFTYVPANYNLACGGSSQPGDQATAIDLCSNVVITYTDEPTFGGCPGGFIRHWMAQDACGNIATADQIVSAEDAIAPEFVNFPEDLTTECDQIPPFEDALVSYVDNCTELSLFQFEMITPGFCPTSYTIERTWVVQDACGNATSRTWTIYVIDETGPDLSGIPSDLTLECGTEVPLPEIATGDNCSSAEDVQLSFYEVVYPEDCGSILVRVWDAYDACGNVTTAIQNIHYIDQTAPVFTFVPASIELQCGDVPMPSNEVATAADNCSDVNVSYTDIPSNEGCAGSMIRRWTAMDACGNVTSADQIFISRDDVSPVIVSAPNTVTVDCDGVPSLETEQVIATDNCSDLSIQYFETSEPGFCPSSYTLQRTAVVTDACGNAAEVSWTYYVIDESAPVIEGVLSTVMLECGDPLPEVNIATNDNCSPDQIDIFYETQSTPLECGELLQRIWTATDACGNSSVAVQEVTIMDQTPPVLVGFVPELWLNCGELVNTLVTAEDACGEAFLEVSDESINGSCNTILRTYRAMDACGNQTIEYQTIHFTDEVAPEFTSFPSNITVACAEVPTIENAAVQYTDACSVVTSEVTEVVIPGDCPQSYALQRTWVLTDACGNTASRTWIIQAIDADGPQILNVPADVTIDCSDAIPAAPNVVAIDDCDAEPQLYAFTATETIGCTTYFTRRWYALDACGNVNQAVQLITITDQFAPELSTYPEDLVLTCGTSAPVPPAITATDNCAGTLPVQFTEIVEGNGNCSSITRNWCATDCVGQSTCHTQTITFVAPTAQPSSNLRAWQTAGQQPMVRFTASKSDRWRLDVMDMQGRHVKDLFEGVMEAGEARTMEWNTQELADGIYIVRFTNGVEVLTSNMVILH